MPDPTSTTAAAAPSAARTSRGGSKCSRSSRSRRLLLDESTLASDRLEMNRTARLDETEQPGTTSETAQKGRAEAGVDRLRRPRSLKKRLPRHAESLHNPGVAPTDESGPAIRRPPLARRLSCLTGQGRLGTRHTNLLPICSARGRSTGGSRSSSSAPARDSGRRVCERTSFGASCLAAGGTPSASLLQAPQRPIRRRLTELPPLVVNRGGEYCFIPSLSALRWLSDLET